MEGLRGERTVVDDAGSSGDAALVLVARTHARNTAAVSLPKEGREWGGGRDCEGLYLPRAGTVEVCIDALRCAVGMLPVCWLPCRRSGAH